MGLWKLIGVEGRVGGGEPPEPGRQRRAPAAKQASPLLRTRGRSGVKMLSWARSV